MAAKPSDATTTIDSLAELLKDKGKMELSKIAAALGVQQSIVENWAKVLEGGNLVKITYEVGKMYVEPKTVTREQEQAMVATVEAEKVTLENDLALQRSSLDKYSLKLESLGVSVQSAELAFRQRFPQLETQLEGVNKIYAALESENEKIDTISKRAQEIYASVNKRIDTLYGKVEGVDANTVQNARDQLQKIQDVLKKGTELESQLTVLSASKDKAIETIRKSVEDQLKSLEADLTKVDHDIDTRFKSDRAQVEQSLKGLRSQMKSVDDISRQVNSFGRERESIRKTLDDTKNAFNDEYARISNRMDTTGTALRSQIKKLMIDIAALKESFGEVDKMYDTVQKSKVDIDAIKARIVDIKKQTDEIADELKALETLKGSVEAKARATTKAEERIKEVSDAVDNVDSDISELSKNLGSEELPK